MPFKDTPNGTTHSYNDGCGEPAHNDSTNCKQCQPQPTTNRQDINSTYLRTKTYGMWISGPPTNRQDVWEEFDKWAAECKKASKVGAGLNKDECYWCGIKPDELKAWIEKTFISKSHLKEQVEAEKLDERKTAVFDGYEVREYSEKQLVNAVLDKVLKLIS